MKAKTILWSAALSALAWMPVYGASTTFTNGAGTGQWNNVGNWNSTIPTNADTATISSGRHATVSAGTAAVGNIINVGYNTTGNGTLTVDGGSVNVTGSAGAGELRVGWSTNATGVGTGTLSLINGGSVTGNLIAIARGPGTYTVYDDFQGWVSVDETSSINVTTIELARRGRTGTLELLGRTGSTGGASVSAATLTMGNQEGKANLLVGLGATLKVTATANLGGANNAPGTSSATINGGSMLMENNAIVHGHATFNLTDAIVSAKNLQVRKGATLSANVIVSNAPVAGSSMYAENLSMASGAILDGNLVVNGTSGKFSVVLSGASASLPRVVLGDLSFINGGLLTIDYTALTDLSLGLEINILEATSLTGLNFGSIVSTGLVDDYAASYRIDTEGGKQVLVATLTNVPEPAMAAALLGLVGFAAVMHRRRRA